MSHARRFALALAALMVLGATAAAVLHDRAAPRERARRLYGEALERRAASRTHEMFSLLVASFAADPTYLPPVLELSTFEHAFIPPDVESAMRSAAARHPAGDVELCLDAMVRNGRELLALAERRVLSGPARDCIDAARHRQDLDGLGVTPVALRDIAARYPEVTSLTVLQLVDSLPTTSARKIREAEALLRTDLPPLVRVTVRATLAGILHRAHRDADAIRLERVARAEARALGPGALYLYDVWNSHESLQNVRPDLIDHVREIEREYGPDRQRLLAIGGPYERIELSASETRRPLLTGDLALALKQSDRWIALADSLAWPAQRATAYVLRGKILMKSGRATDAERWLLRAAALADSTGSHLHGREAAHDLLHVYESLGRFDDAIAAGGAFRDHSEALAWRPTTMMSYHDLAYLHRRRGDVAAAQRAFNAMIALIDAMQRDYFYAGEYYEYSGMLDSARYYYERSAAGAPERQRALAGLVRIAEQTADTASAFAYARAADIASPEWPEYVPMLPGLMARHGQPDSARALLDRELHRATQSGTTAGYAQLALELAELLLRTGSLREAARVADTAAAAAARVGMTETELLALSLAAHARIAARIDVTANQRALDAAARRADAIDQPLLSINVHTYRGDAHAALGELRAARAAYARAGESVDAIARNVDRDATRASFRAAQLRVSNRLIGLAVAETSVLEFAWWSAWRKGGRPGAGLVETVRRRLGQDDAVIDYVMLDTTVAALVITRAHAALRVLPVRTDSLRARIARVRMPLSPIVGGAIDRTRLGFDSAAARQLYDDLVAPLRADIGARDRLLLAADGVLHTLPFDALVTGYDARGAPEYVLDSYTVAHVPSLDLIELATAPVTGGAIAVIGGPADGVALGTHAEISAILSSGRKLFTVLNGSDATPADAARLAQRASIVHFATHAEANDHNPDFARLALNAAADGDGWLNAYEIAAWRLPGSIIVLSACETAAGRVAGGEGALSLNRAFLRAGASTTIATLWPIGEPTAQLMAEFYGTLGDRSVADAFREARLSLRHGRYSHPFYWAPFIVTTRRPAS